MFKHPSRSDFSQNVQLLIGWICVLISYFYVDFFIKVAESVVK